MSKTREVLLVGEGNFSFSAALSETGGDDVGVTATCFQSENETYRQEGVALNVQRLRERGSVVLFEVDCTCLKEHEALQDHLFDCVIFNFPHCGRKSGVKKNRVLLMKFFLSAVAVLKDNGEVHVTLCNGQGGTPCDSPMREWHNSWQVVAMAAEAGLILREIRPFECEMYQGYRCTGYRSQDKGFHVEGALTHIFTSSLPHTMPEKLKMEKTVGKETVCFELPAELSNYINRNFLGQQSHHPVKTVQEQLHRELKSVWPVCTINEDFPELVYCLPEMLEACDPTLTHSEVYWIKPTDTYVFDQSETKQNDCESTDDQQSFTGSYALRPSLLLHVQEITQNEDFSPGTLYAVSGLVFQRVPICPIRSPAFHQLLLVGMFPVESHPLRCFQDSLESLLIPYDVSFEEVQTGLEQQVWINSKMLPKFGRITYLPSISSAVDEGLQLVAVSVNLDHLATLIFGISDWRLLWSADPRFLKHFELSPSGPFSPFSLYPPSYLHDISFWMDPENYDELDFHAIVREASCGVVKNVALVDRFRHPHMGHASLCYRLTYQSSDRALSNSQVLALQNQLRRLLALRMQVTLR
ncbi:ferredoxin-fold anticodon-binding domain-containing protein 1 [Danio rerio]|uniref:phenylalanine--tRNA ligase n=1 Tax=Danio rerio TaxID=7955 RepID=A5PMV5_DANRE|nr:ferredoxin-fold anticodon-binding domain-containing protein 1 [Danio rerio]|eukprot:NP_001093489.1 ferredoxin-fold anticodon-binding domain-containing protein 1 [Danio rerio]